MLSCYIVVVAGIKHNIKTPIPREILNLALRLDTID